MIAFRTEQEAFWAGEFGTEYAKRNTGEKWLQGVEGFWRCMLSGNVKGISTIIEFGANIGLNILALQQLFPSAAIEAVEINPYAAAELGKLADVQVYEQSILDFVPARPRNLVITKGLLIHIHPEHLPHVYDLLYRTSDRYIFIAEYYNPYPMEITYRGHAERLFKRDFAGELMDRFPELTLEAYGFVYHRDAAYVEDDTTWFLLEKKVPAS